MDALLSARDVLAAMITPAVLISASGTLALSTSNRLTRVVDRVRTLAAEAEQLPGEGGAKVEERRRFIAEQLSAVSKRALVLRTALTVIYTAICLLVACSIAVGLSAVFGWAYGWAPVGLGLAGAGALFHGALLLVREGRIAVGATLQELARARQTVAR